MYSAPGKLILAGEHAVVYNQPALAIPLMAVRAQVAVVPAAAGAGLTLHAPDLGEIWRLQAAAPLSDLAQRTLRQLELPEPDATLTLTSTIPIASGMGSGAAVGAALVRALAGLAGRSLDAAAISALVYESERTFHGTPSGIDNTVVAYEQPIIFQRQADGPPTITPLQVGGPWRFVVVDSGVASHTKAVVGDLRRRWQADPAAYAPRFAAIGALVQAIALALRSDSGPELGRLLDLNHAALVDLGVSAPELDRLVLAARRAGAWGAKMSGAGWGGVMLALVPAVQSEVVAAALRQAGATRLWTTELGGSEIGDRGSGIGDRDHAPS
ncbi:MAG: mevalonate kinase [Herpetosiphonaceae bacterium]|nr:mevalonate kinase [Herpetosiphonaceae bacterium]